MPALIPVVIAAAVSSGAGAALLATGAAAFVTAAGTLTVLGTVVAGLVGSVVATGVSMLMAGGTKRQATASPDPISNAQDRKQSVRQPTAARSLVYGRARVGGVVVYASSSGEDARFLHMVSVLATHPIGGFDEVWINDTAIPVNDIGGDGMVTAGPMAGRVRVRMYDGTQTDADPLLVAESPDGWSEAHRLLGCAYIYVRLEYEADVFQGGLQGIGATIRGKADIEDPRSGVVGYTNNWALCVLDYLRSPFGMACAADEIDLPSFVAAANISDEAVVVDNAGASHARYTADGVIALDATRRDILSRMLSGGAGTLVYIQGRYRLHAGAYSAPTDTLGISDLAGAVRITTRAPRRDLFNGVKGTFIDPARSWQAAEYPAVSSIALTAEDGEPIWRDVDLPVTIDPIRAQRLARIELLRGREALTIEAPVLYRGLRYAVWQMLSVTIPDLGLAAQPMRIMSWTFDAQAGVITLRLRVESAAAYAWSFADATVPAPAPVSSLVSPLVLPAPAGLDMTEELFATRDGQGLRSRARLAWLPVPNAFVAGYDVQVRRLDAAGNGTWRSVAGTLGDAAVNVDDLADGPHQFRVRARSTVAVGQWAVLSAPIGALAAQPPAAPTGLAIQTIGGMAFLRWDQHPEIDVRIGGRFEIRHSPDVGGLTWAGATSIGDAVPGSATFAILPLKPGTYLVKALDAGGRASTDAAGISTTAATALTFANLSSLTEHPGFSGTRVNTIVTSLTLRLGSLGNVDPEASWDAIASLDGLGGVAPAGSYAFSGGIDLGSVKPVRITGRIKASVANLADLVDQRPAMVDAWTSFDGVAGGEADAWIEVRDTQDNPGGTPVWSAWRRVDQAEARARGFQFRAELRSFDPAFNIHVAELSAALDEVI